MDSDGDFVKVHFEDESKLLDQRHFARVCLRHLNMTPYIVKENTWFETLNANMSKVIEVEVSETTDTSASAEVKSAFFRYLAQKRAHEKYPVQVKMGLTFFKNGKYYFTNEGFERYLAAEKVKVTGLPLREHLIRFGAKEDSLEYKKRNGDVTVLKCWSKEEDGETTEAREYYDDVYSFDEEIIDEAFEETEDENNGRTIMLKKSSNILVLIKNEDVKRLSLLPVERGGYVFSRADRDYSFYDLIVCEEDALEEIGDHNGIILLLKATTKIKQFIGRVNKFIRHGVSYEEFSMFLYIPSEPVLLKIEEDGIEKLVPSGVKELNYGDLYINFEQGIYVYQGKEIYLTKKEKEYLMKFFFTEENLSKDRVVLHRARKKFGKDFLTKRKENTVKKEQTKEQTKEPTKREGVRGRVRRQ